MLVSDQKTLPVLLVPFQHLGWTAAHDHYHFIFGQRHSTVFFYTVQPVLSIPHPSSLLSPFQLVLHAKKKNP